LRHHRVLPHDHQHHGRPAICRRRAAGADAHLSREQVADPAHGRNSLGPAHGVRRPQGQRHAQRPGSGSRRIRGCQGRPRLSGQLRRLPAGHAADVRRPVGPGGPGRRRVHPDQPRGAAHAALDGPRSPLAPLAVLYDRDRLAAGFSPAQDRSSMNRQPFALLAVALAGVLAACGGAAAPASSTAPSQAAASLAAPDATSSASAKPAASASPAPLASAAASASLSASAAAKPATATDVQLALGYIPNVQFAPFYLAEAKGFYRDEGINISFDNGISPDLIKAVGAGKFKFAIADADTVISARAEGIPVTYVASFFEQFPAAIISLPKAGISQPASIKGKKVGIPGQFGSSYVALLELLGKLGLTEKDIDLQAIGFNQPPQLLAGKVDAVIGFANNDALQVAAAGTKPNVMMLGELVPMVGSGLVTNDDTLKGSPQLVQGMVRAMLRGMQYTM